LEKFASSAELFGLTRRDIELNFIILLSQIKLLVLFVTKYLFIKKTFIVIMRIFLFFYSLQP